MTVHTFKAAAGRDLILGQLMHAMQADDYTSVWILTLDLLERHAKDPATVEPFHVAMEYLHEHDQPLTALRIAGSAVGFAAPGSPLMEMATALVVNGADHVPPEDVRIALAELSNAAIKSHKDQDALVKISEKLCETARDCGDLHRDFAMNKVVGVMEKLILPEDYDGDLAEFYFADYPPPAINTILPPDYLYTLAHFADQYSHYDQQTAFELYQVIMLGFSENILQGYDIPEKVHALMLATDTPVKLHMAFGTAALLVDGGMLISEEMEDSALCTMERTNAILDGEVADKNVKPVSLKDFLAAFTPPDGP